MSPTRPFKFNPFAALMRAILERQSKRPTRSLTIRDTDIPEYLRHDIGLPAPHRRAKAQDPPRIDPVRYM